MGGKITSEARDASLAALMRSALAVSGDEERVQAHVHGFHSYPARLHPETAAALIRGLTQGHDTVLDPFCGSGTVVVEARALGRRALGSDLNPLGVELARLKTAGTSPAFAAAVLDAARSAADHALGRQKAESGPTERYGPEDRTLFAPHVLLELDGLRDGIERLTDEPVRRTLSLVLSALLTKVSQRTGDSSERDQPKRIARGFAIRFFVKKTEELSRRLTEYQTLVPDGTPRPRLEVADARRIGFVRDASVELIVSSPPYPGVYDYYEHHRLRLRWLRWDARAFARNEIGSRRDAQRMGRDSVDTWERDFAQCLREMRRVLRRNAHAALLVADSVLAGRPMAADEWLPQLADRAGLSTIGHAAQERPYFHLPTAKAFRGKPRYEHLFIIRNE